MTIRKEDKIMGKTLKDSKFKIGDHVMYKYGRTEYAVDGVGLDIRKQKFEYDLLSPTTKGKKSKVHYGVSESKLFRVR